MALEAIGISVASDLTKDNTKDLLVTVKRQAGYFFCFNNIAKDLGTKKEKLVWKQQGLLRRAEDANNNTEQISDEAHKWLEADLFIRESIKRAMERDRFCDSHGRGVDAQA